jgi:hypothetical protein
MISVGGPVQLDRRIEHLPSFLVKQASFSLFFFLVGAYPSFPIILSENHPKEFKFQRIFPMARSKVNKAKTPVKTKEKTHFPDSCLVCDSKINQNSVLFHCECVVAMCNQCAINMISFQKATYLSGIGSNIDSDDAISFVYVSCRHCLSLLSKSE